MAGTTKGAVKATANQKRLVMSRSSRFSASTGVSVRGSRAMPHIGQVPGAERTISGCMGQVHSVAAIGFGVIGSSAMPHFGHEPGPDCRTSGCIGHVYKLSKRTVAFAGCEE